MMRNSCENDRDVGVLIKFFVFNWKTVNDHLSKPVKGYNCFDILNKQSPRRINNKNNPVKNKPHQI